MRNAVSHLPGADDADFLDLHVNKAPENKRCESL
jgi:hypothetical protein